MTAQITHGCISKLHSDHTQNISYIHGTAEFPSHFKLLVQLSALHQCIMYITKNTHCLNLLYSLKMFAPLPYLKFIAYRKVLCIFLLIQCS